VNSGTFVSDNTINNLIEKIVSNKKYKNKIIFDGYPRNIQQAKNLNILLKKYEQKIDLVISLNVSLDLLIKRISGRLICSKCGNIFNKFFNPPPANLICCKDGTLKRRSDDNAEITKKRHETYENLTKPLLEYYGKSDLLKNIDGENRIEEIATKIAYFINLIRG
jgi:adenylate kinase